MSVLEETRAIDYLSGIKDHLVLSPIAWSLYETLLDNWEREGRRYRHTYDRGQLEVMTRSSAHEVFKSLLGLFVVTVAEEWEYPLYLGGEVTVRQEDLEKGLEPDQGYWIAHEPEVRGKTALDFTIDPVPDLFIEIEVSRTLLDRLEVLAALRVPEIWRFDGDTLLVGLLGEDGHYVWGKESRAFPTLPVAELARFLHMAQGTDHMTILRRFRAWLKSLPRPHK
jgi:Uma2 family endonuclease